VRALTIEEAAMALWMMRFGSGTRPGARGEVVHQGFDPAWLVPTPGGGLAEPTPAEVEVLDVRATPSERLAARQQ
jgi:hypothetical protein